MTKYTLLRGGVWLDLPVFCRSAFRDLALPSLASHYIGFRVCCPVTKSGDVK